MNKQKILAIVIFLSGIFGLNTVLADSDTRQKVIELLTSVGLSEQLKAGVKISSDASGVISIADQGNFFMQYMVVEPNTSADANLIIDPNIKIPSSVNKAVIVTHGWIDKASSDWPADIAEEIRKKVDPNEWVCVLFDWWGGAAVVNPEGTRTNSVRNKRYLAFTSGHKLKIIQEVSRIFGHFNYFSAA